jgi:hypothetical protein
MRANQCVSVTELAKNTSGIIRRSSEVGTQYVFVNNKPQAVILSMEQYEIFENMIVEFGETERQNLSTDTQTMYDKAKKLPKDAFIDF